MARRHRAQRYKAALYSIGIELYNTENSKFWFGARLGAFYNIPVAQVHQEPNRAAGTVSRAI